MEKTHDAESNRPSELTFSLLHTSLGVASTAFILSR